MPKVEGWVDRLNGFRRSRDESDMQAQKRSYDLELDTVRMMHRYDVHFMIGTDAETFYPAGFGLHKELSFFVSAGFLTLETLQAATLNPATYLGRQKDMGTVESGKIADLVILDARISKTPNESGVIVGGRYFDPQGLNQLLTQAGTLATSKR